MKYEVFRLWDMKYEAVSDEKMFEHSPKASKHKVYILFKMLGAGGSRFSEE